MGTQAYQMALQAQLQISPLEHVYVYMYFSHQVHVACGYKYSLYENDILNVITGDHNSICLYYTLLV